MSYRIQTDLDSVSIKYLNKHLEHFPGCYDMADVTKDDKDMEYRMDVWNFLETV